MDGIDIAKDAEAVRRRLGVLPDARGVYKRLTPRENIAYFGRLHGLDGKATIQRRSDALIHALGMSDVADRQAEGFRKASAPRPRLHARLCTTRRM